MTLSKPTIVAIGGGGCGIEPENRALDEYLRGLTGKKLPRVCFVPTASGDNDAYIVRFFSAFETDRWVPSCLRLFLRTVRDLRELIMAQDLIYVGGGNTAAALAIWRQHGLDTVLREAWEAGILLAGPSAGGNCWFEACSTDSFGLDLDPLNDGLGFLPGSFCPHYDGEARRRPTLREFVTQGRLPAGWATDNYAALRFEGTELVEAIASKPTAKAYRVYSAPGGNFVEEALETRVV